MNLKRNTSAYMKHRPSLFIKECDVMEAYKRLLDPGKLPVEVSDFSLLVVSLTWGALLDTDVSSTLKVVLLDTVLETLRLLPQQKSSIREFLVSSMVNDKRNSLI